MAAGATGRAGSAQVALQRFGAALSSMVMPNIAAFIAWGLITALFIETGWINVAFPQPADGWVAALGGWGAFQGKGIVIPMITYLLPLMIGYSGGRLVHGVRGGVVGATATMGVIVGADVPMFLAAMVMGPLAAATMKRLDLLWAGKVRPGFEMLVDNFAAGAWGGALAIVGFLFVSPVVHAVSQGMGEAVEWLVSAGLLPLTSILIEPAKVLFLNNAINHGILTPLGTQQAAATGRSVLFLLEANPGPGLGLLVAFMIFGRGTARASAPGAAIVHFLGGVHEIYFPYVLMRPALILSLISGGMTGVFLNVALGVGLRAPAAPGSIFAVYLQASPGSFAGVTLSVVGSAAMSLVVASSILGFSRDPVRSDDLAAAASGLEALKGATSAVPGLLAAAGAHPIRKVVFACDAGMGSSAMGASMLRRRLRAAGLTQVSVLHQSVRGIEADADLVITQSRLTDRARLEAPQAVHVSVDDFIASPAYDEVVAMLAGMVSEVGEASPPAVAEPPELSLRPSAMLLAPSMVRIHPGSATRDEALQEATDLLVAAGAVTPDYFLAMQEREEAVSTYMGHDLAIPHGTTERQEAVLGTAITFVRYDGGVDWDGRVVSFVVGIAGKGRDHLDPLARIAMVFSDDAEVAKLREATSPEHLHRLVAAACTDV